MHAWFAGLFAFAAIHYAIQWWFSRYERILLLFSMQCALFSAVSVSHILLLRATTISDVQTALDRVMTIGVLAYVLILHVCAHAGARRDHVFRAVSTVIIVALVVVNQWVPLRGTVIALEPMSLPGGGVGLLSVRTPPGTPLVLLYLAVLAVLGYGLFVARTLWRADRFGALLLAIASAVMMAGVVFVILVDFAGMKAPYPGALPSSLFVLAMAIFLSREYSARGARIAFNDRRFEAAFEHAPIGKALLAPDGRFLRANRAFCGILGSTADEICAGRLQDIVRADDDGSIEAEYRRLLTGAVGGFALEIPLVRKDGAPAWAQLAMSAVPDDRGRPVQMIAQIMEVTELRAHRERLEELVETRTREMREARDEAERASQTKSRFLAHMSHEIRSPLHVMVLNAQLIELDAGLTLAQRKRIENVQKSGEHLAMLINSVLEMSRIEAGRLELVAGPFDLAAALDEVAQMFALQAASKGTDLTIEFGPDLPRKLFGDGGKVKQALINLVSNAVKFTRGGSIRVTATSGAVAEMGGPSLVEIVVADTGIGIEAQDLARMFRPFEQLDAGARAGGTGLGLAITIAYAKLLGGDLHVESTPGIGSTFRFSFGAMRTGLEAGRGTIGRPSYLAEAAARHSVLVVDDAEDNRNLLAELMGELGFEVRTAADGATALLIHADWGPDIVLMDLRMPGMNGIEAIRLLRAAGSSAAIGALTAGAFGDDERQALVAGADFFIRKPYEIRDLLDKIGRALDENIISPPDDGGTSLISTQA